MAINPELVRELRQRFIDGATPSRLMAIIAERHNEVDRLPLLIKDYFREAFGIPLLRNVPPNTRPAPGASADHFSRDVLPEIVQRIDEWNVTDLASSWLNGLKTTSQQDHAERLQEARFEELDRVWETLDERERRFIVRKIAQKDQYWEIVKILAALAERLQEQVIEQQSQIESVRKAAARSNGDSRPINASGYE
jgi:hypothetical protein